MMSNAGAVVYWIDKSFSVRIESIPFHQLKRGATYESEALWITDDAEHMEVILMDSAGNASEVERIKTLKKMASDLLKKE